MGRAAARDEATEVAPEIEKVQVIGESSYWETRGGDVERKGGKQSLEI